MKTKLKIFRVTSTHDSNGRLVKAPTARLAEKHVIAGLNVEAALATQDELIEAGANGETAEVAGE